MADVSLELLQSMVQSVLDEQKVARGERGRILQRLSRVERMLLTGLRAQLDNAEAGTSLQDQLDSVYARLERLESQHG